VESNGRFDSFDKDITRQLDGRYCTPIPWAIDKWRLEKNHQMASGRLQSMLNRLRKSPDDLANYTKEIEQLKTNKFVEEADIDYNGTHGSSFGASALPASQNRLDRRYREIILEHSTTT
jgi:hypothetical protein